MPRFTFLFITLLILTGVGSAPVFDFNITVPDVETSLGVKDDPQARMRYLQMMLASPSTGLIPSNIRARELAFDQKLSLFTKNSTSSQRKASREWISTGPFNVGGRTRGAGIDSRNDDIILAGGVSGGIWKSTNGGDSWVRVTDPEAHNGVSCMVQDSRAGKKNIWYVGTGEQIGNSAGNNAQGEGAQYRGNGIYKSTDNGASWQQLQSTANSSPETFNNQFQYIWNVLINNQNLEADEVWAAAYGGILRSMDGGESWNVVLGNKLFDLPDGSDINQTTDPSYTYLIQNSAGHFFASMSSATSTSTAYANHGFYFSAEGDNWQKISPNNLPQSHGRTVIASGISSPGRVYFLTFAGYDSNEQEQIKLWLYSYSAVNNGRPNGTWTDLSNNIPNFGGNNGDLELQGGYNMLLSVHPEVPNLVFIGGTNLYRSTDGFFTSGSTDWIGGYHTNGSNSQYPSHHADQHLLLYYPSDPNRILSCHDGGLSVCTNILRDSVIYRSLNNGYVTSQFFTVQQQKDEASNLIIGGMQDNGAYIGNALGTNPSWTRLIGGDGGYSAISNNNNHVYVGFQNGLIFRLSLNSTHQLTGFARVDPSDGDGKYLFINPYILDPQNHSKMFLAGGDVIWRNHNLSQIPDGSENPTPHGWQALQETRIAGYYTALEKSGDVLYAGALIPRPLLVKVENAAKDAQEEVTKTFVGNFSNGFISSISAAPDNSDHLLLTLSNYEMPSVFLSVNGGNSFTDVSGNLEENPDGTGDGPSVRWAEIALTESGYSYFLGTSIGLFSTTTLDGANTIWTKESPETIGKSVITMIDYRGIDGRILASSHGNGTFRSYVENPIHIENDPMTGFTTGDPYPNPFDKETLINYTLHEDGEVRIRILDSKGSLVKTIVWGPQYAGINSASWDGTNDAGVEVPHGTYFYHITASGKSRSGRVVKLD